MEAAAGRDPVVNVLDHLKEHIPDVDDFADQTGEANEDVEVFVSDKPTETVSDPITESTSSARHKTRGNQKKVESNRKAA